MVSLDLNNNPFLIIWEATRACNLVCRHCRAEAHPRPHPDQLTSEQSYELIEQVKRANPVLFVITGGDPMCRPDLNELIAYSTSLGLRVGLSPSATPRLLRADFEQLRRVGVRRMSLSIDGPDEATHDAFRGVKGAWKWTMKALEKARTARIPIQINTTITKDNINSFESFVRLMDEVQPMVWTLFILVPTGRGKMDELPSPAKMESFFTKLYRHAQEAPYDVKTTEGMHYRRVVMQKNLSAENEKCVPPPLPINDGNGFVFVSHTGEICPSGFLPEVAGNVKESELIDVYRESQLFRDLRNTNLLQGKCGYCGFNDVCGGSRARAFALTGNRHAEEPLCIYQPPRI